MSYGLKEILQLQPVRYNWKDEKLTGDKIGLVAQQVQKIIPEVVTGDGDKEILGVNYSELIPVLIKSVKELKGKLEILRAQARQLNLIN